MARTARPISDFRPYKEARDWARKEGIRTYRGWWAAAREGRIPDDIPKDLTKYSQFHSYPEFLGTKRRPYNRKYAPLSAAMEFAQGLGFKTGKEWQEHWRRHKIPTQYPKDPRTVYGDEFMAIGGYRGFLGVKRMSYAEAVKFVREMRFGTFSEFDRWARSDARPKRFPRHPHVTYKNEGFSGYQDFLGIDRLKAERKLNQLIEAIDENDGLSEMVSEAARNGKLTLKRLRAAAKKCESGEVAELLDELETRVRDPGEVVGTIISTFQ